MIADRLNGEGVDSPRFYHYKKVGRINPLSNEKNCWGSATVMQLLRNEVYIGNMVQGKRKVVSYRTKTRREVDPKDWIVVEGTHEPIIDRELWDQTHAKLGLKEKVRKTKGGVLGLFSSRIYCSDCKSPLAFMRRERKNGEKFVYRCSRFNNNGGKICSTHNIDESYLSSIVLNDIRLYAKLAVAERERLSKELLREMNSQHDAESKTLLAEKAKIENRLSVISSCMMRLFEDKCQGNMSERVVNGLLEKYAVEQNELEEKRVLLTKQIQSVKDAEGEIADWMDLIERQLDIEELDRATVMELIDRVEVSETRDVNGEKRQDIFIKYRFIGNVLENTKEGIA